ncbi:hypothetical protein ACYFX5_03645 [Bremerella sp. T1]|uniref:hypothetical protein n=1 Tax=Bremerella sp. TYQ1 TaxID=3119568 RepID=UPI001CCBA239|nr:hypothetical protein [Bremerella volcania]UBM37365.1 hypothetical protein LA756_05600 [Bremerella volcania]
MHNRITDAALWVDKIDPWIPPTAEINSLDDIKQACPAVRRILNRARNLRRYRRPHWRHYEAFKAKLTIYVGWHAEDERLRSSRCYELCISALTKELRI